MPNPYEIRVKEYRAAPSPEQAQELSAEFDVRFSRTTGYDVLDKRIGLTRGKKAELLVVRQHPEVPLTHHKAER